jgi:hypothetical protein
VRFTVSDEAIERLGLPELKGKEFEGPRVDRGIIGGFTIGEIRWAKKSLLRIDLIQEVDAAEIRPLYFALAIRRTDPRLLPEKRFSELMDTDFVVAPHEYVGELRECGECLEPVRSPVHEVSEDEPGF